MQCYREQQLLRLGQVCLFVRRCLHPFTPSVCQYLARLSLSVFGSVSMYFPFMASPAHMQVMPEMWRSLSQSHPSLFLSSVLCPASFYFLCLLSLVLSSPSPSSPLPDSCIPALPSDRAGLVGVGVCVCCVEHVVLTL